MRGDHCVPRQPSQPLILVVVVGGTFLVVSGGGGGSIEVGASGCSGVGLVSVLCSVLRTA